jgi:hypothetical protein
MDVDSDVIAPGLMNPSRLACVIWIYLFHVFAGRFRQPIFVPRIWIC